MAAMGDPTTPGRTWLLLGVWSCALLPLHGNEYASVCAGAGGRPQSQKIPMVTGEVAGPCHHGYASFEACLRSSTRIGSAIPDLLRRSDPTPPEQMEGVGAPSIVTHPKCDESRSLQVSVDFMPGQCPNLLRSRARGSVTLAIAGSADFDVRTVDPGTVTLTRTDHVGGTVASSEALKIADLATPFVGSACTCHNWDGDLVDDVAFTFSTVVLRHSWLLDVVPRGESIEIFVRGKLADGTPFEGTDCFTWLGRP